MRRRDRGLARRQRSRPLAAPTPHWNAVPVQASTGIAGLQGANANPHATDQLDAIDCRSASQCVSIGFGYAVQFPTSKVVPIAMTLVTH
jgi:hypothetical protein